MERTGTSTTTAVSSTILLIEDDECLRGALKLDWDQRGFRVLEADGAAVGLHLAQTQSPDIVVLDRQLPDGDGIDVLRKVRGSQRLHGTPVIMLTGRASLAEKSDGVQSGADQYLVKPCPSSEIVLWIEALLRRRRAEAGDGEVVRADDLSIDLRNRLVRVGETAALHLTGREIHLLYHLVKSRPRVLSRKYILSNLWHTVRVDRLVDTYISRLRRKLPPRLADRIQTVPGLGFRFF